MTMLYVLETLTPGEFASVTVTTRAAVAFGVVGVPPMVAVVPGAVKVALRPGTPVAVQVYDPLPPAAEKPLVVG
jgi:hypothetical protein